METYEKDSDTRVMLLTEWKSVSFKVTVTNENEIQNLEQAHILKWDSLVENAKLLIENGANKKIKNDDGKTPFQNADKEEKELRKVLE